MYLILFICVLFTVLAMAGSSSSKSMVARDPHWHGDASSDASHDSYHDDVMHDRD